MNGNENGNESSIYIYSINVLGGKLCEICEVAKRGGVLVLMEGGHGRGQGLRCC